MARKKNRESGDRRTSAQKVSEVQELRDDQLEKITGGGVGSQSTGAGAGKVTFNPFSITRKIDKSTPSL